MKRPALLAALLACGIYAVYVHALSAPFYFDDYGSIFFNASIRNLHDLHRVLTGGTYATVVGRPLLNLSLAIDYAWHGISASGFRVTNLMLHTLAALAFFGVLRRTLRLPGVIPATAFVSADGWAFFGALLWALHPLQTESVMYICQRAEILVSLFYLAALYAVVRSATSAHGRMWHALAILCGLAAVAAKEVAVTLPIAVLLYDRAFLAGSFREAWRRRWGLYLGLAGSWLLLGLLVAGSACRSGTAGFGLGLSSWHYAISQPGIVMRYLRLAVWPFGFVFDYGDHELVARPLDALPWIAILLAAGALMFRLDRFSPRAAFPLLWVPLVLTPTSSIVPLYTQTAAEHRMYLPLAGLTAAAMMGLMILNRSATGHGRIAWRAVVCAFSCGAVACLGLRTVARNNDYRDPVRLWGTACAVRPGNPRAQVELGAALRDAKRYVEAERHLREAVRLDPTNVYAHYYLGRLLGDCGRMEEGDSYLLLLGEDDIGLDMPESYVAIALALARHGRKDAAMSRLEEALRIDPSDANANFYAGCLLGQRGLWQQALTHFDTAMSGRVPTAELVYYHALALNRTGRLEEARTEALRAQALGAPAAAGLLRAMDRDHNGTGASRGHPEGTNKPAADNALIGDGNR